MMRNRQGKAEWRFSLVAVFLIGWFAALYTVHAQASGIARQDSVSLHYYYRLGAAGLNRIRPVQKGSERKITLHANPIHSKNAEKHHKRTIVSPLITPVFSFLPPEFTYSDIVYTLFLPGGCCTKPARHFSLRGPPASC